LLASKPAIQQANKQANKQASKQPHGMAWHGIADFITTGNLILLLFARTITTVVSAKRIEMITIDAQRCDKGRDRHFSQRSTSISIIVIISSETQPSCLSRHSNLPCFVSSPLHHQYYKATITPLPLSLSSKTPHIVIPALHVILGDACKS